MTRRAHENFSKFSLIILATTASAPSVKSSTPASRISQAAASPKPGASRKYCAAGSRQHKKRGSGSSEARDGGPNSCRPQQSNAPRGANLERWQQSRQRRTFLPNQRFGKLCRKRVDRNRARNRLKRRRKISSGSLPTSCFSLAAPFCITSSDQN